MTGFKIAGLYPLTPTRRNIEVRSCTAEPLGLGKILAIAKDCGADVLYENPQIQTIDSWVDLLEKYDPDILAFSLMTFQMPAAHEIAKRIKTRRKDTIVLAGGYHPSSMETVDDFFDAYIMGEGEIPFQSVIQAIIDGKDWTSSPGLLVNSRRTPMPDRIENIDIFPRALRCEGFLRDKYSGLIYPTANKQTGFAYVEYGRGCKAHCSFCCKDVIWGDTMTFHDPAMVVKEMLDLQKDRNVNLFFFSDLNFTANSERVHRLCDQMKISGFSGSWFCMSNISTASSDVLEAMVDAGCVKVMYGVESVNSSTLRKVDKTGAYERDRKVIQNTLEFGMVPHVFYMVGFPWETRQSIESDIERLQELPALQLRIAVPTPFPGSRWFNEMKGLIDISDLSKFDCEHLVFRHDHFVETELLQVVEMVYKKFYESCNYQKRVEQFVDKWPRYKDSFTEFFDLLDSEKNINVSPKTG